MRKKRTLIYLTLAAMLVVAAVGGPSLASAEAVNLVKNPGFEQLTNNFPTDWAMSDGTASNDQVKVEVSQNNPHSGSNCLKIENDAMKDSMVIQAVNVKKDTVYQISCWIRTENIVNEPGSANLTLYYDNNGIDCKGIITSPELQNTNNQWSKLEFKFRTLKLSETFYVAVRLGGQGTVNQGIAYFDDLTLQESDDSGQLLTFFIPGANSSSNSGAPSGSGPNKVIIYVILGILAIGILVFLESKLGKKGKKNEAEDEAEEEAEDEAEDEEAGEDEEVEESEDDEVQDDKGKKK